MNVLNNALFLEVDFVLHSLFYYEFEIAFLGPLDSDE